MTIYRTLIFAAAVFSCCSVGHAEDWPQWMGPRMDGVWRETGIIESFPDSGAKIVWRQPLGPGYSGPSVVGDRLFCMDRVKDDGKGKTVENAIRKAGEIAGGERIQCLDVKTGETIWSHTYDCPYKIAYPSGPRCTPTVDGDYVYSLGAMGDLICFKVADGTVVWKKNLPEEYDARPPLWGYSSHPIIDGDQLLVPAGGEGSGVVALNKKTGKEIWKAVTTKDVAYAPLVFHEKVVDGKNIRQLLFWHADGVTSLNPESGEENWYIKFPEEVNQSQTQIATPRVIGDRLFISEYYKGSLMLEIGSNPPSVKELWRSYKTDPRSEKSLNSMITTPLIKSGHAIGIAYNGKGQGVFRCVDLDSGELKWSKDDWEGEKPLMFASAFIVENGDHCILFNDIGELMIVDLSPEGFKEISRAKIVEPTTPARGRKVVWAHPAFSNGRVYVRNDEEIVCVDMKK